jgi:hypothetical protein
MEVVVAVKQDSGEVAVTVAVTEMVNLGKTV